MLILCMAFYKEALPIIKYLKLKKDTDFTRFQLFRNEKVLLLITGTGKLNGAVALTTLCSIFPPSKQDILVNIGVCGCTDHTVPEGTVFLCNKIYEAETRHTFYPDMLYSHPFLEGCVITSPLPVTFSVTEEATGCLKTTEQTLDEHFMRYMRTLLATGNYLIDMEASGLYQSSSYYFNPHQVIFLKVVSDYIDPGSTYSVTPQKVSELLEINCKRILDWLFEITDNIASVPVPKFTPEEETAVRTFADTLKLSVTMEHSLLQYLWYYKLKEGLILPVITNFLEEMTTPCKTKLEGKKYFDKFKQRLL